MSLESLQPVNEQQAKLYQPYIQDTKRRLLPLAISLYQKGVLEGHRKIEAGDNVPFVVSWNVGTLPSDLTRCRMQFDGDAELNYEVMMASHEFISFLIELMENTKRYKLTDFPQSFYRRLLRIDE